MVAVRTGVRRPNLSGLYYEAGLDQDESTLSAGYATKSNRGAASTPVFLCFRVSIPALLAPVPPDPVQALSTSSRTFS